MNSQNQAKKNKIIEFILIIVCFLITFYPVLIKLIRAWSVSDEYSHGFLIIPISLYIIWDKKEVLRKLPIRPSWAGLFVSVLSLMIYVIANYAETLTLGPISMVLFIFGIVLYLFGYDIFKELLFPLFFLFFMIPVPSQIYASLTIPLQLFVSKVSVGIAGNLNVTIFREGNVIHLADRTLEVVQACSGLRSIVSLLTLSAVFGYMTLKSNLLRGILFFSGLPVAVFVNIFRVLTMILAFHYFNYDLTEGSIHTTFGIVVFCLALLSIALIKKVLSFWDRSAELKP